MTKADLSKQPEQVAHMFDEVSTHYDRTNAVMSVGNSWLWRIVTARTVSPREGERVLDLAAGTGTSSAALARSGAEVVAADFSRGMIAVGAERNKHVPNLEFTWADATELPFEASSFDAVTISFGLRNIVDPATALAEMYRVLKPGGRLVICEFSTPPNRVVRNFYRFYLNKVTPSLVALASSNPAAYSYLSESIIDWPDQPTLAAWMREAGFNRVAYRNLTAGIVAVHRGVKDPAKPTGLTVPVASARIHTATDAD